MSPGSGTRSEATQQAVDMALGPSVLDAVGRTPVIQLRRLVPPGSARVLVKLESHNPTGSMKDRMALAVVRGAERAGRLLPGGTLVEYTGGSTGTSLAFVCAAMGHPAMLVTSDAFSREKRDHMRALGATVVELPSDGGRTTRELIQRMIARAAELAAAPGALCITGVATALRQRNPRIRVAAVEPAESPVLGGGEAGAHRIEGVGPGFVPPLWRPDLADEVLQVSTAEAIEMTRRLAREEGLLAGTSSGANLVAALRVAERLGPARCVGTVACDSGLKYLSTDPYSSGS